ncbi:MAG: indolepyruvate oxidoreductase subunit beta family protein [Betaproteobacteria bacterium]
MQPAIDTEAKHRQPVTLLICALGGEGGGVLSEWVVDAALQAGYAAQSTSIPGVAQRTGATTYYVEIFPAPLSRLGGMTPVFSLYPVPGALDLLVSSELLETVRQVGNAMASPERTQIISSSSRTLTTNERMQLGDGRVATAPLAEVVRRYSREHHLFDMGAVARESGTVVSAVMFGAVAASGVLPLSRADCEAAVRGGGRGADASLRGFARAYDIVSEARERTAFVGQVMEGKAPALTRANGAAAAPASAPPKALPTATPMSATTPAARAAALPPAIALRFPAAIHDILALGFERVREYQDAAYADLYTERLGRILAAESSSDPQGARGFATTQETARYLALWMAFDDIVRVAELKCRASRLQRVRDEVKVADGDLLRVYDHFKPGVPEFAALLPAALAGALTRWDRRRQARGKPPFALPLKIGTHGVAGFAAIRALAGLKWLRRRGSRFAVEQALIERWVVAVTDGARLDWTLGNELALCGRLIKGYGSTNERGKENLLHVIDHLAQNPTVALAHERAAAIRSARVAALADEAAAALDRALVAHGAPARPVKEIPIRFVRTPRTAPVRTNV